MSHPDDPIDDGQLHAFLDGALPADSAMRLDARIAADPVLRARVERARLHQREADDLLALVELDPPLAAASNAPSRAAAATPARPMRSRVDPGAFRWAATFLLIVGGVWMLTPSPQRRPADSASDAVAAVAASSEASSTAGMPNPEPDVAIADRAPPSPAQAAPPASSAPGADAERQAGAPPVLAALPVKAEVGAEALAIAKTTPNAERRARAEELASSAPVQAAPPPVPMALGAAAAVPRRTDLAGAAALLGGAVRTLAAAELQRAEVLSDDPPHVRLTYRLADGTLILLDEKAAGVAAAADAAPAPASARARARSNETVPRLDARASQLRWTDGTLQLELQAAVSTDSLRRLRAGVQR